MPSQIAGQLLSNGRVALINANGVVITSTGVINTRGFTASTLNLADDEFIKGKDLHFSGSSDAVVSNEGQIIAREGDVFLMGQTVSNSGKIDANNVALAAGAAVTLKKAGDGRLSVEVPVSGKNSKVTNTGSIKAVQARLRDSGGNPYVLGMNVDHGAEASPESFSQGQVVMTSGRGTTEAGGSISAGTKAHGGRIDITGKSVTVKSGAKIDASGDSSGGDVKIGGGFQGKDASISNADLTRIELDASISADARVAGSGGKIVVWSDQATTYQGNITARGAGEGGGGSAEVSGKEYLDFRGTADLSSQSHLPTPT